MRLLAFQNLAILTFPRVIDPVKLRLSTKTGFKKSSTQQRKACAYPTEQNQHKSDKAHPKRKRKKERRIK